MPIIPLGILSAAGAGGVAAKYWMALFGNTGEAAINGNFDDSGNLIAVGSSGTDAQIVKYDSSGNVIFQRNLSSGASESFEGIDTDSSNNIYAVGWSNVNGSAGGNREWLVAKYNSGGSLQWQRRYSNDSGNYSDTAIDVASDASGNIYPVGWASDGFTRKAAILKYNASGTLQWQRRLGNNSTNVAFHAAVTNGTDVYVAGYNRNSNNNGDAFLLVKYDSDAGFYWQRRLQNNATAAESVALDSSGNPYIFGWSNNSGIYDFQLAKYDSSGNLTWQRRLGSGSNNHYGMKVIVSNLNNVFVTGYSDGYDIVFAKYNSSGTIQFQRRIRSTSTDVGLSISVDTSENISLYGYTDASSNNKMFIARLPADGSLTGTYSLGGASFVYEASTNTDAASSLTANTPSETGSDPGYAEGALSLTDSSTSLTSTVTFI